MNGTLFLGYLPEVYLFALEYELVVGPVVKYGDVVLGAELNDLRQVLFGIDRAQRIIRVDYHYRLCALDLPCEVSYVYLAVCIVPVEHTVALELFRLAQVKRIHRIGKEHLLPEPYE